MDGNQTQATDTRPHVIIVGAGFGGLMAANALKHAPVRLTVIDRTNHHLFQPLLYQVATAGLSPADIASPIRHILRAAPNTQIVMAEVTGVDLKAQRVLMHEEFLSYDYLIIATGATHSYFGHEEWERYAPGLKSVHDATTIRQKILQAFENAELECDPKRQHEWMTFVLVGAGPTGAEMAGAISELAHQSMHREFQRIDPKTSHVLLLEAGPRILASFPEELANKAQEKLKQMGVDVRTNARVEGIDAEGVTVKGEHIPSKTVIWTAGVAASPAGKWLGAKTDKAGRVFVQPDLTVEGSPNVFVIGDTAHLEQDGKLLPGVAQTAMQQGKYVASVVRSRIKGAAAPAPFRYWDKGNLATIGRRYAIMESGKARLSGFIAWVLWLGIHIFYLIGFRNRLLVFLQWTWAYFTFERGVRLITMDANQTQKELAVDSIDCLDGKSAPRETRETRREETVV